MIEILENRRNIVDPSNEINLCGVCGELASNSCTDAKEIGGEWTETPARYGCLKHPAEPLIYFACGQIIPAKEWEKQNG